MLAFFMQESFHATSYAPNGFQNSPLPRALSIKDDTQGDDADELRFRYAIQIDGSDNFECFVEALED